MTPAQALAHYGSQAQIARSLGIRQPSVFLWFRNGRIPAGRQYQIELATQGILRADTPPLRAIAREAA